MMAPRRPNTLKSLALAALLAAAPAAVGSLAAQPAQAATGLPAPYVSRALDAVLIPVDASVIGAFGLAPEATGVLVVATQPGGLAEGAGIQPGDVIDYVGGTAILTPAELDQIVYDLILAGTTDFAFAGARGGEALTTETVITIESWEETVEITEISSWSSYSSESFSYEEFSAEYSEEMASSYEASASEESATEEAVDEGTTDEAVDEGATDEAVDDGGDAGGDDGGGDEGGGDEAVEE